MRTTFPLVGVRYGQHQKPEERALAVITDENVIFKTIRQTHDLIATGNDISYAAVFYMFALARFHQLHESFQHHRRNPPFHPKIQTMPPLAVIDLLDKYPAFVIARPSTLTNKQQDAWEQYTALMDALSTALNKSMKMVLYGYTQALQTLGSDDSVPTLPQSFLTFNAAFSAAPVSSITTHMLIGPKVYDGGGDTTTTAKPSSGTVILLKKKKPPRRKNGDHHHLLHTWKDMTPTDKRRRTPLRDRGGDGPAKPPPPLPPPPEWLVRADSIQHVDIEQVTLEEAAELAAAMGAPPREILLQAMQDMMGLLGQSRILESLVNLLFRFIFAAKRIVARLRSGGGGVDAMDIDDGDDGNSRSSLDSIETTPLQGLKEEWDALYKHALGVLYQRRNLRLNGNPGTGKTTIARIYQSILFGLGIDAFMIQEGAMSSFVASYEGQTQTKAYQEIIMTVGTTRFYDESYQLVELKDGKITSTYGEAAITVIMDALSLPLPNETAMRNPKPKGGLCTVIFAGYEDRMNNMFDVNDGLPRRFSTTMTLNNIREDILKAQFMERYARMFNDKPIAAWFPNITEKRFEEHVAAILPKLYEARTINKKTIRFIDKYNYDAVDQFATQFKEGAGLFESVTQDREEILQAFYENARKYNALSDPPMLSTRWWTGLSEDNEKDVRAYHTGVALYAKLRHAYSAIWNKFLQILTTNTDSVQFDTSEDFEPPPARRPAAKGSAVRLIPTQEDDDE